MLNVEVQMNFALFCSACSFFSDSNWETLNVPFIWAYKTNNASGRLLPDAFCITIATSRASNRCALFFSSFAASKKQRAIIPLFESKRTPSLRKGCVCHGSLESLNRRKWRRIAAATLCARRNNPSVFFFPHKRMCIKCIYTGLFHVEGISRERKKEEQGAETEGRAHWWRCETRKAFVAGLRAAASKGRNTEYNGARVRPSRTNDTISRSSRCTALSQQTLSCRLHHCVIFAALWACLHSRGLGAHCVSLDFLVISRYSRSAE